MSFRIDPKSPVPLYHQIAEAIRYRIATGALPADSALPPLREAARLWKVNLHTVRKAYEELGRLGFVTTRAASGTRVAGAPAGNETRRVAAADRFLAKVVREAREKHGLGPEDLIARLATAAEPGRGARDPVAVVECSETQCIDLAGQIAARWRVIASPRVLDHGEPPEPRIIATYFHFNDVRRLWPNRLGDLHFLAIRPDPALVDRIRREQHQRRSRMTLLLCEREQSMADNIAADLARIFPVPEFRIVTRVSSRPGACLKNAGARTAVLFSPRSWGGLTAAQRADERAHEVRYVFEPKDLEEIGSRFGWDPR